MIAVGTMASNGTVSNSQGVDTGNSSRSGTTGDYRFTITLDETLSANVIPIVIPDPVIDGRTRITPGTNSFTVQLQDGGSWIARTFDFVVYGVK